MISNSTWDYKIPTVDTIPKQFNVEVLNTGYVLFFKRYTQHTYVIFKAISIALTSIDCCLCQLPVNLP
jgi:hypothetical protein